MRIGFASTDGISVNEHFGHAKYWEIYDLQKEENVTPIEYDALMYGFRKELGDEGYTFFWVWKEGKEGVLGISESSNRYITIQTNSLSTEKTK